MEAMKKKSAALSSAAAEELSRLLTHERLKHAGVVNLGNVTNDPDLKPLADAVKKVSAKKRSGRPAPFTPDELKKLAGF
jgi:hypothetical protein